MNTQTGAPPGNALTDQSVDPAYLAGTANPLLGVSKQFSEGVGARIREARGAMSREEFASLLQVHINTLGKLERGETLPDAAAIYKICRISRRSPMWLVGGDATWAVELAAESPEFVLVPGVGVSASAGPGSLVDAENEVGKFAFKRVWLQRRSLQPANLRVVPAKGDSMEPTVKDGDILLVDMGVTSIHADGIYLIEQAGELRCKRLQLMVDGGVRIRSDNTLYEPETVPAGQADMLRLVAKVVWIGGER